MAKAKGSHIWDVDGHEFIDYIGGHGGNILGHTHPAIIEAVNRQMEKGAQFGTCCELSVEWAELIGELIPSAERVEFTSSGTEAVMFGIRLARAFTGRSKIIRFRYHFAGAYDAVTVGVYPPFDVPFSTGIIAAAIADTIVIPENNEEALEDSLKKRDVAAVVIEAAGCMSGIIGIKDSFYSTMRELTQKYGTLLFFDEIVTGFRYSPGGVQAVKSIIPDLTSLGKDVNGTIPGSGAIVGRKEVMDMFLYEDGNDNWNRFKRVSHYGTFNANPLCSAAGIASLKLIATGEPTKRANEMALNLRDGMQNEMDKRRIPGCVWNAGFSYLHIYFGECEFRNECKKIVCLNSKKVRPPNIGRALYINFALNGIKVRTSGYGLIVSSAHTQEDINRTVEAFSISLKNMIAENKLSK
jgi:glutamate-1-semialdehyde 2,1-aminomutase